MGNQKIRNGGIKITKKIKRVSVKAWLLAFERLTGSSCIVNVLIRDQKIIFVGCTAETLKQELTEELGEEEMQTSSKLEVKNKAVVREDYFG